MKPLTCILFLVALARLGTAQSDIGSLGLWHFSSLSGSLKFNTQYRDQQTSTAISRESPTLKYFTGGVLLNTRSYIWHPNFLKLEIGVDINPGSLKTDYVVLPDISEVNTLNQAKIKAIFFDQKVVSFNLYGGYHNNVINRENLNSIRSNQIQWGGAFYFKGKFLPLRVDYSELKLDQLEVPIDRSFNIHQRNIRAEANKSFTNRDKNKLIFSSENFFRKEQEFSPLSNLTNTLELHNDYKFDDEGNYTFRSDISNINRNGANGYKRFRATESLTLKLPANFRFSTNYKFEDYDYFNQRLKQHSLGALLNHQLYLSLRSTLFFDYFKLNQTSYEQGTYDAGFSLFYTKKIFKSGKIDITYQKEKYHQDQSSADALHSVSHEEYTLTDGEVTILISPYIDINTITVEDASGTIIYDKGLDYLLFEVNNYIEIQRVAGGQIPNNGTVFVNYTALLPGSYQYNSDQTSFSGSLILFDHFINLYYRFSKQDFNDIQFTELLTLNEYTQKVYGAKLDFKFLSGGVEIDNYASNVIPYDMTRYFARAHISLSKKVLLSIDANYRYFRRLDRDVNQQYFDISGKMAYRIKMNSKLNTEVGYRKQNGEGIDLDLVFAKGEFTTYIRNLFVTMGIEFYHRNYIGEEFKVKGGYFKIERRF